MKRPLEMDVNQAARWRLHRIFDECERVYLSFSGGKDSGVLLNMALDVAKERGRLPLDVLTVDLEGQYAHTVDFVRRMLSRPDVRPHWVCLPLHLRNSVSQFQPFWLCWDPDARDRWVREMPTDPGVISDESFYPWFRRGMEFEDFVPLFAEWFADGHRTACLVAIRSDESLNRYRTIASTSKTPMHPGWQWTTEMAPGVYNAYPIYDWRTEDIWTANGRFGWDYNRVYDLMHLAGLSIHQARLCQPYGDDQRKGLWLFRILEPDTWAKVVARVEGANFGARHAAKRIMGRLRIDLPPGHTWESYSKFLLATMPPGLRDHYIRKLNVYFRWWAWYVGARAERSVVATPGDDIDEMGIYRHAAIPYGGFTGDGVPNTPDWREPPWQRICRVLLKNDYWCKGLGFSQTQREHDRLQQIMMEILNVEHP